MDARQAFHFGLQLGFYSITKGPIMSERVIIEVANHIAVVTLNRADKMNALDPEMFKAINNTIDELRTMDDVRVVVLKGQGRAFCAGLDLSNFTNSGGSPGSDLIERTYGLANAWQQVAWGWRTLDVPVIAAVHGIAFGGGFQIMSGADIRFIHPDTRCSIMEMKWGLVPDMGGFPLWRGIVREDHLRQLIYTNEEFSGTQAQAMGFATHVAADPLEDAMALATVIAGKNPAAIRGSKRICNLLGESSDAELLMAESVEQDKVIGKPNQIEAVMAQMEGRAANFH